MFIPYFATCRCAQRRQYGDPFPLCDAAFVKPLFMNDKEMETERERTGIVCCLRLRRFLSATEIEDDQEREEVTQDILEMLIRLSDPDDISSFISSTSSPPPPSSSPSSSSSSSSSSLFPCGSNEVYFFASGDSENIDLCIVLGDRLTLCAHLVDCLNGQVISGAAVRAQMILLHTRTLSHHPIPQLDEEEVIVLADTDTSDGGDVCTLVIRHFYTEQDLVESMYVDTYRHRECIAKEPSKEVNGSEEIVALKTDLVEACQGEELVVIGRTMIVREGTSISPVNLSSELENVFYIAFMEEKDVIKAEDHTVIISASFDQLQAAQTFMCSVEGVKIDNGNVLRAFLGRREITSTVSATRGVCSGTPVKKKRRKKKKKQQQMNGDGQENNGDSFTSEGGKVEAKYTPDVVPSKYRDAIGASKQGKHAIPTNQNVAVSTADVDILVGTMLSNLIHFQRRAIEKDPVRGKMRQRLVSGLRQVTNSVKSGRARLVLLAVDTEESEALDGMQVNKFFSVQYSLLPVIVILVILVIVVVVIVECFSLYLRTIIETVKFTNVLSQQFNC